MCDAVLVSYVVRVCESKCGACRVRVWAVACGWPWHKRHRHVRLGSRLPYTATVRASQLAKAKGGGCEAWLRVIFILGRVIFIQIFPRSQIEENEDNC